MKNALVIVACILFFMESCAQKDAGKKNDSKSSALKDSFLFYLKKAGGKELKEYEKEDDQLPAVVIAFQSGDSTFVVPETPGVLEECQCAFEEDTLIVVMGVVYMYGTSLYVGKVSKNFSGSSYFASSENPSYRKRTADKWEKEIEVPAKSFTLILSKEYPFRIGETIFGFLEAEYPPFEIKEDDITETMTSKIKAYFACKVDEKIF